MSEAHQREAALFDAAMELPPEQRAAYLDQACGNDAALHQRMEALLKASESSSPFLDSRAGPAAAASTIVWQPLSEKAGDRIGRYKLLQEIGEGGCGVVYMAEQEEPVRRRVALKIIKLGMDTKSVIARFEAERQALALMDHPNIAKVLDAGATETGRPYFVMELVRGMRITDYCDEKKLPTRERLNLFIQVCQAIQHAHQKGIIHRDIKPSNILVTVNDGVAVPKVIDFGIAKATSGQQLTDKTLFTAFEQFIGTPAYMSPEQATLTSLDIDTRSDIYALGVLLYELLTGKTPFDAQELLAIGLDEMRRTIREQEPPRPSTRLSTLPGPELSTTAQHRSLDAPKLVSELRGDLDWIAMKALEKDRTRRYETANGLAMDIQRHLQNEPVVACPPSNLYRFRKLVRRNKLIFATATSVATALIIGLGISTWMYVKEREALKRAVAAEKAERKLRQEAELRELNTRAYQLASYSVDPESALQARMQALDAQRKSLGNVSPEVADSLEILARMLQRERKFPDAEKAAREALEIRRKNSPGGDLGVVHSLEKLAWILNDADKSSEAEEVFREALNIQHRVQGKEDMDMAVTMNDLGALLQGHGKEAEAVPLYRQAFTICRKVLPKGHSLLVLAGRNLLLALVNEAQLSEAAGIARDFVPANENAENGLGYVVGRLASELASRDKVREAEELLNDLVSKAPDSPRLLLARASFLAEHRHFDGAAKDFRRLIELEPDEHWRPYEFSAVLAASDQKNELEELCRRYFKKFGDSKDYHVIERGSKAALLVPLSSDVAQTAIQAVEKLDPKIIQVSDGSWNALMFGLADYRGGKFQTAIDHLSQGSKEGQPVSCRAQAFAIAAMAHYQLKQFDQAHDALAWAKALGKVNSGDEWHDWIRVSLLVREASSLIEGDAETTAETR